MIEKKVSRLLIIVFVAFLFASFMFSSLLLPVKAAAQVTIVNHNHYMDAGGYYHVIGEVQNTGDVPVTDVHVSITVYDVHDVVLESSDEQILLLVLLVGRKSPFMYTVSQDNSAKVSYYYVSISSFQPSSEKPLGLQILSHNYVIVGFPVFRVMTVTGQVQNIGVLPADAVYVVATFYDGLGGTGNVIGVSLSPSAPVILPHNEIGTFSIPQDVTGREQLFVSGSYVLTAESLEYADIVPEFPAYAICIIFMAITLIGVVVTRRNNRRK